MGTSVYRLGIYVLNNHRYYCPEGSQSKKGFNGTSDHPCPPGTFSNQTGASSINACLNCPPGTPFSSGGASFCSVCENGKYEVGAKCLPCEKGHWCGSGRPYPCPVNTYAASTYPYMHDCMEGAIGTGTKWVQDRMNVKNVRKIYYPRKAPHKLETV